MSTYRIAIDRNLCTGFGACVGEAPDALSLDASSIAVATADETDDARVRAAADACPMGAIRVETLASAR